MKQAANPNPSLETTTVTQTSTVPVTQTATTTSTVIAYAVATTIASNGAQYRQYQSPYTSDDVSAAYFKTVTPVSSGTSSSLTFSTPDWPYGNSYSITLADGYTFNSYYSALLFQGFFIAKETGTYLFYSSSGEIDNWGYVWTGSNAYAAWADGNENFKNHFDGGDTTMSTSIQMNAGDAVPLTYLWINTGGPGQSKFRIRTPGGTELNGGDGYFVKACSAATFP
ncbi:hypothetical protein SLS59_008499 [Nothophoma quercina]|uniref:PA14 domain-containing protein n=1 Tax=Nothophoma quercina TaxID=749835 RepID=A0ABR3QSF5_9PLEO